VTLTCCFSAVAEGGDEPGSFGFSSAFAFALAVAVAVGEGVVFVAGFDAGFFAGEASALSFAPSSRTFCAAL
jgi:hypothetical protein